ncbi:unnamed protein product [Vicia faba]|uniref:F-box domain-containing protein n=1 Tax=Vicia faba TaxID=3906 RepID=A0AAV0ZGW7_VICFA|nr:unnamed protein product [Vicia faba]
MSSRRSIPTMDRISELPDSILCQILSILPTKLVASTSLLSKRWRNVWLSIFTLNFNDESFKNFETFQKFVYSTMFLLRDQKNSIHSFTLKLGNSSGFNQQQFNRIFKFVMQRGVQNIDFNMSDKKRAIKLPLCILNVKTLTVLKLENIKIRDSDQVDFPRLKTLYFDRVYFSSLDYFVKFLNGCPILEDLNTKSILIWHLKLHLPTENLNSLPNLVKASICYDMHNFMTLVSKVKILHLQKWRLTGTTLPMFHNLTHLKLSFNSTIWSMECKPLIGIFSHFPNLQHFNIENYRDATNGINTCSTTCLKDDPSPTIVPECLSLQLKTFSMKGYAGRHCEFKLVQYIMQHSKVLETMIIKTTHLKECNKYKMLLKLSSCSRGSPTCKLIFD